MCHFTKKNKETVLFKAACKKHRRQKRFWKKVKTIFSDKSSNFKKYLLLNKTEWLPVIAKL